MNAAQLFAGLRIPPGLAIEFFVVFARFEFALKDAGYVFDNRGYAAPRWSVFEGEMGESFARLAPEESARFRVLIDDPPMRQVLRGSTLTWEPLQLRGTVARRTLTAARQVRNNLFHGGKHSPHSPDGRDAALVAAALDALHTCLRLHERVRAAFEQVQVS